MIRIFQDVYDGTGPTTWDYPWFYALITNSLLCVAPSVNMVQNIGFGADATNTTNANSHEARMAAEPIAFPLTHPPYLINSRLLDDLEEKLIVSQIPLRLKVRALLPKRAKLLYKRLRKSFA